MSALSTTTRTIVSLAFGAACLATAASALAAPPAGKVAAADRRFIEKAAVGGMAEVELGKLAQTNGASDQVKQFGARMSDDHAKANDELKQIASAKGVDVPAVLDSKTQATVDKMKKLTGAAFDKAYMADMLADHKEDIALFQTESLSGQDADVKAFAGKTLPTLREHLRMAQTAHAAIAGSKAAKTADATTR
jgi:putative membrane protein